MIFFLGISLRFRDSMHYDRAKFRIGIISLEKVTSGSCALQMPHSDFLNLFANIPAQINANKIILLENLG